MISPYRFDLTAYLAEQKKIIEQAFDDYLPVLNSKLYESISYSLKAGGKRLRPILCLATSALFSDTPLSALPVAVALEMIHTYSLIHDDLPAMDNDALRRGQPTNHKIFGEGLAILAGDALLTEAFRVLARNRPDSIPATLWCEIIGDIAEAAGLTGMVAGQARDLEAEGKELTLAELSLLHEEKTGKLIQVAVESGAKIGSVGLESEQAIECCKRLAEFGQKIGLAFQIMDDVLDLIGGEELGKDRGSDLVHQKSTYPRLLGNGDSIKLAKNLIDESLELLEDFNDRAAPLRAIAKFVVERKC